MNLQPAGHTRGAGNRAPPRAPPSPPSGRGRWGRPHLFVVIFLPLTILVEVDTDLKLPIPPPPNVVEEKEVTPPWPSDPKDVNPTASEGRGLEAGMSGI